MKVQLMAKSLIYLDPPYPLPPSATRVGVHHTIFWRENMEKLHQLVLEMLRMGFTPESIAEMMQKEKVALLQTSEYIDAMREHDFKP
jgi:site-specific DNA-adenine methylase